MSKKAEAFALFAEGKDRKSPEVQALELKRDTLARYWFEYSRPEPAEITEPTPEPAPPAIAENQVLLSSLAMGQRFIYQEEMGPGVSDSGLYRKGAMSGNMVIVERLVHYQGSIMPQGSRRLSPGTFVEPNSGALPPVPLPTPQPPEPEPVAELEPELTDETGVRAETLVPGQKFMDGGQLYRRTAIKDPMVIAERLVQHTASATLIPAGSKKFDPTTLVKIVERPYT